MNKECVDCNEGVCDGCDFLDPEPMPECRKCGNLHCDGCPFKDFEREQRND